ncbi:MAG: hypothetical protein JRN36_02280, partial [Nitrososphaerota archaeon]|nr:hypothetical protein [Nitrososphaerota archaeon]
QRQIGDLTFIHGEFQKALTLLRPLADLTPKDGRARAETLRIIGHVYRFNMMLPDAERVYLESMRIADAIHAVGLKGELLNNLTETLAWKEPSRALQFGDESLKHNQSIAFRVEVGKTKAALAVAHALLGSMKEAHRLADEARNEQNTVGYLGGILVAEMAEFYIAVAERETQHARQQAEVARDIIHRMDSNFFLELPLAMGLNLPMPRDEPIHAIEWLELDQTIHVWEDFFARLSSQSNGEQAIRVRRP